MPTFPTTGLVSYWKLDEASGTRSDSHGTNHLTPTNAPVGAAGKIGNGCDFESSSSQYLSHADPTPLGDEDFTYTLWFKLEALGFMQLIGKDAIGARSYWLEIRNAYQLYCTFGNDLVTVAHPVALSVDGNWHFVVLWHDAGANTLNIQLDNGAPASVATGGAFPPLTSTPVHIGSRAYTGYEEFFDGLIDEVGLWRRVLTAQERTDLYNGGAGLAYAPPAPPVFPITGLVSYWALNEASGTRIDSHGTNHLTPTNAPVGAAGKIGMALLNDGSKFLTCANNATLQTGDISFTWTCWVKATSLPGRILGKGDEYQIYMDPTVTFLIPGVELLASTVVGVIDTWYFIACWRDQATSRLSIQVNNGTVTTGGLVGPPVAGTNTFYIAQIEGVNFFLGLIDEVGFWKRVLTAQERTDLYNGGAGLAYSTGATYGGDLTTRFVTYLANLRSASPGKDLTTLVAKDLPVVRAAHPLPTEVDDRNTLYAIHLD